MTLCNSSSFPIKPGTLSFRLVLHARSFQSRVFYSHFMFLWDWRRSVRRLLGSRLPEMIKFSVRVKIVLFMLLLELPKNFCPKRKFILLKPRWKMSLLHWLQSSEVRTLPPFFILWRLLDRLKRSCGLKTSDCWGGKFVDGINNKDFGSGGRRMGFLIWCLRVKGMLDDLWEAWNVLRLCQTKSSQIEVVHVFFVELDNRPGNDTMNISYFMHSCPYIHVKIAFVNVQCCAVQWGHEKFSNARGINSNTSL